MRTVIIASALLISASAAHAKSLSQRVAPAVDPFIGGCEITHNDAAELTYQHFMRRPYEGGHVGVSELVYGGAHPDWEKWSEEHLVCAPGACSCTEK